MAKVKGAPTNRSSYFRQLFADNPDLLDQTSNDEIRARWEKDHPGEDWDTKVQQSMANIKSILRKKLGKVVRRRRRRRKAVADTAGAAPRAARAPRSSFGSLERMEGLIDECLSLARQQGTPGIEQNVMKYLRQARRGIAWEMGQPAGARE